MTQWTTDRIGPAPRLAVDHMGSGELLVFLHGIGGNKRNWHDNLPAFASHWHAAAWDARGYGESDDYEGPLTFSDFSHDLARVLDHFGAAKAHIVGLSMGGRIAQDFAALYPDRLLTLTLCDTHRGFSHFSEEKRREFIRLRKEPLVMPFLAAGLRISFGICWKIALVAELFGAQSGLGYLMLQANGRMQIDLMFAALLILAAIGVALYFTVDLGLRRGLPWLTDVTQARSGD